MTMYLSEDENSLRRTSIATVEQRRDFCVASLDLDLKEREDGFAKRIRATNVSVTAKLGVLYKLTDELGAAAAPADYCHINVSISEKEAKAIGSATGRMPSEIPSTRRYESGAFSGRPCPFLRDSVCSIYAIRPYVRRTHFSFERVLVPPGSRTYNRDAAASV